MLIVMHTNMLAICHDFKVFNSIILFIPIFVMYNLIGVKKSAKMILHYDPVFQYITIAVRVWMLRNQRKKIITSVDDLLNLPHRTLRPKSVALSSELRAQKTIQGKSGREDSNLRPLGPKPSALPLRHAPK